ncbi:hypothetical protein CAFEA_08755 [Corynebacterium afermentans subsp. afermentans]|uniref:Uncharacterized protein n=1 Tax=Corynebacterium afermentans TaxID=38286 RepID=A0A9X8R635_9CORY|nr:hypothetical protein [Corynebacterium afermentans]MCG7292412.1 hypothetical protein [Corynebacterium afermentans]OAA16537.1 hypothetical protein Caferm_03125 [Corynebacterium afermentans subsp. afermentans]WJY57334.1 hypothetical protein CAFEA_08755 [Corynebacterium afermentans subsp. afermentans]SIQ60546.1 hypothetical protein SAMN05421802_12034 [Corynebacterium afermentans]
MVAVRIERGARGLTALLSRALALDAQASARIQEVGEGQLDVFVTTPFDAIASRRTSGSTTHPGATVSARAMLDALKAGAAEVGPARDAAWPGALPPASGFIAREEVPIGVARRLADEGRNLARQFSGPAGPPRSLLDGVVLTADADSDAPVEIPMRMIFACTALGLIPGFEAPAEIPRHMRVATSGSWVRLDAPFGSVYRSTRPNLLF